LYLEPLFISPIIRSRLPDYLDACGDVLASLVLPFAFNAHRPCE
jgi:hypothetical protein